MFINHTTALSSNIPLQRGACARSYAHTNATDMQVAHSSGSTAALQIVPSGTTPAPSQVASAGMKSSAGKCPFAQAATFFSNIQLGPRNPNTSVLTEAGGVQHASAHVFLAHGVSGQPVPGKLISGLRKLTDLDEFLIQLPHEMMEQLPIKRRAFEDPVRRDIVFAAEPDSLEAQHECLDLFLEHLPQRYPHLYAVQGEGDQRLVTVHPTGETHRVVDYAARPLELCCRIVQEDLVLIRAEPLYDRYVMSAAAVVFSFGDLHEKLSQPMPLIHAPVPGYERDLDKLLAKTFSALRPDAPLWRNNWGIANSGELDEPLYGTEAAVEARSQVLPAEQRWLKTEYETLRRLPKSQHILFTVRTFLEPLTVLKQEPAAAAALAQSLAGVHAGMSTAMRAYKGLVTEESSQDMLDYLMDIAEKGNPRCKA